LPPDPPRRPCRRAVAAPHLRRLGAEALNEALQMKTSRTALVAMLVAVELLIAGFGIWTFRNGSIPAFASTMHHVVADPKPVATLALGAAPHVVVEDPDSRVIVKVSSDGL